MNPDSAAESPQSTSRRRRSCVSTACQACRKRKSKCDGNLPVCMSCKLHNTKCEYNNIQDARKPPSRQYIQSLQSRLQVLESLINQIRTCEESELQTLIKEIRSGNPYDSLSAQFSNSQNDNKLVHVEANAAPSGSTNSSSLEDDLSVVMGSLNVEDGEIRYYGATSNLNLLGTQLVPKLQSPRSAAASLKIQHHSLTEAELEIAPQLLKLYWIWQAPYFVLVAKPVFNDIIMGGKYASPFLLNAVLAHAAHLSDHPYARADPNDPTTTGDHFFEHAKNLMYDECEKPSVTTVQALTIMGSREAGRGQDATGWMYSGMAFRMALDLGLHRSCDHLVKQGRLSKSDAEIRAITFWGCAVFDRGWSAYMGRPTSLPVHDIKVPLPSICFADEAELWEPFFDNESLQTSKGAKFNPTYCNIMGTFHQICYLTETLGSIVNSVYNSDIPQSSILQSNVISEHYLRLQSWFRNLPHSLRINPPYDGVMPQIIMMHLMYHTSYILLFRPFLSAKKRNLFQWLLPRTPYEICRESAMSIATLISLYRDRFSLRCIVNLSVHVLFTASTVLLLDASSSNEDIRKKALLSLNTCTNALDEISIAWPNAGRSAKVIRLLAEKWGIPIITAEGLDRQLSFNVQGDTLIPQPVEVSDPFSFSDYSLVNDFANGSSSQYPTGTFPWQTIFSEQELDWNMILSEDQQENSSAIE